MKKLITLFYSFFILAVVSVAQTHYVIAFDCTKSMDHPDAFEDGDYSDSARDVDKVWEPAKGAVRDIYENAENNDRLTIILFQDKILEVCDGQKSSLSWTEINNRMEKAIGEHGNTCILSAWERAEQYLANSSAPKTMFYLITDGEEEHDTKSKIDGTAKRHTEELCQKIKQFCSTHSNTDGFYTNLVRSLHNRESNPINKALEQSECFKIIIAGKFDSEIVVDMDEEKKNHSQCISIIFHPEDRDRVPAEIKNLELTSEDGYFSVTPTKGDVVNNRFEVKIEKKNAIPDNLLENNCYSFPVNIKSSRAEKEILHDQTILVRVNYKKSSVVYLPTNDFAGKSTYQKPFALVKDIFPKLSAEKGPTVIRFDLDSILRVDYGMSELFNSEAVRRGSEFQLRLASKNSKPIPPITMLYNGEECENHTATLKSSEANHVIEFVFDKTAKSRKYNYLQFEVVGGSIRNLDRINTGTSCQYKNDVSLTFDVRSNPWYVAFVWILVIVGLVLLVWVIIAHLPFRKMHGCLMPSGKETIYVEGKVKCVLTSRVQKQGILSKLFYGPIVFSAPDPFWSSELTIIRGTGFDKLSIMPSEHYRINGETRNRPYSITKISEFKIENIETKEILTINYL